MDSYEVIITKAFDRDIRSLPRFRIRMIVEKILALSENPRPPQSLKLKAYEGEYRLRVGDYRIFYTIEDKLKRVTVIHVCHRREAYRQK